MYNFFIDKSKITSGVTRIDGADYNHVKNVLRMKVGEQFLISCEGVSSLCTIKEFSEGCCLAQITKENFQDTSLPIKITLFQGLPKSDKLELIIQKAVELGVSEISPVAMERSVVKLDQNKKDSKTARWQAIAESAAKQSKLCFIPKVNPPMRLSDVISGLSEFDLVLVPYESQNGMQETLEALSTIKSGQRIGVVIGPEGGFSQKEIDLLKTSGAKIISLGKRILRTETAAITALSMLMLYSELKI